MKRNDVVLSDWKFALGEDDTCLLKARKVGAIHTWNIEDGTEDTWGTGWYEHVIFIPVEWADKRVWVRFGAVYHDAVIYCNGMEIAAHMNSGYTPFTVELTDYLNAGTENILRVKVFSGYSEQMLPYLRSFDWPNDGGMLRAAHLFVTGRQCIDSVQISARPVIEKSGIRQVQGNGLWSFCAEIDGCNVHGLKLEWKLYEGTDDLTDCLTSGSIDAAGGQIKVENMTLQNVKYWHFDHPNLYTLVITLREGELVDDRVQIMIGFRELLIQGESFYLNGEKVRICGTEWMPGSDPAYGMAEPEKQLERMLICLKESNCVFTRFHWQQDDYVLEWCDKHGMLVQEEIPFWGREPKTADLQQWRVFQAQMAETVKAHKNHPSIVAWGVGNELDGQKEEIRNYIKNAVCYTHQLDESRTANYVSNSFHRDAAFDGTNFGDIKMINEYAGTWMPEYDADDLLNKMVVAVPEKPLVISEFGLCEPVFPGGDQERIHLFMEKMNIYRKYPQVAGTIHFCLNDYRTQMGEEGEGKLRRRVHGSIDINGIPKPSYWVVQRECAPFCLIWEGSGCRITCRKDIPCYSIIGYSLHFIHSNGEEDAVHTIHCLRPGENMFVEAQGAVSVKVYRGNGDFAGEYKRRV